MRDDKRCGRSKEVNTLELIGQRVRAAMMRFLGIGNPPKIIGKPIKNY